MIFDAQNLFSKDQKVTATATSTNTLDLGRGDYGPSESVSLVVCASGFTAGSMTIELQTADACADTGALTSPVTVASFPISAAALKEGGNIVAVRLPHNLKRYVCLAYTVPSGEGAVAPADGKITASLALDVQAEKPLPKA